MSSLSVMASTIITLAHCDAVRRGHPRHQQSLAVYQHILDKVKPERDANRDPSISSVWWVFGRPRSEIRPALEGLPRYIATVETAKHRMFQFLGAETLPDNKLIVLALADAAFLSIVSSRFHLLWALAQGTMLEDRPVYPKSLCFDPFPFPTRTEAQTTRLRALGEELDAHRKAQQAAHPGLTLTGVYNTLEKLRAGQRIEGRDREIYDHGLIGILRDIHTRIDAAVAEAYGWPVTLTDDEILHRLVDLNRERAAEEARGLVRWLRPEYQNPKGRAVQAKGETAAMDLGPTEADSKTPWPKSLPEQIAAVHAALKGQDAATPAEIARRFPRLRATTVQPLLESLVLLGQARLLEGGRFTA